ncbi:hypothetical protein SAMN05216338_101969 [Bradyrhizobium sp. Rc2d]|nr:hypothetical protein SAMN05216338_101969 [Bradyrhizobium sp. Rc2d]
MIKASIPLIYAACGSKGDGCIVLVNQQQAMRLDALIV